MHFTIIHGHPNFDIESARLISERINFLKRYAEILTDQEFISSLKKESFIISVGGPAVNQISKKVQELYGRVIDLSQYPLKNSNNFFGSQNGYRQDSTYRLKGCIAFWGEQWEQTMNHTNDFISPGSIWDDIVTNFKQWNSAWQSKMVVSNSAYSQTDEDFEAYRDSERDFSHIPESQRRRMRP